MSEQLHTAREVAAELGLGAAMLPRYAATYEALSGDEITVHRRDGRLFTSSQLEVLLKARAFVMRTNTDVETALKQALEQPVTGDTLTLETSSALSSATLLQALTDANKAATQPLLDEVRLLREQVEKQNALMEQLMEKRVLLPGVNDERIDQALEVEMLKSQEPATAPEDSTPADRPGVLVRAAQRLERLLYRKG
jgi:hypothetical protein